MSSGMPPNAPGRESALDAISVPDFSLVSNSQEVTDIYSAPNICWDDPTFATPASIAYTYLPAGASMIYPGIWSSAPVGYEGTPIVVFAQMRLDLPAGFDEDVDWPLLLWDAIGTGTIELRGTAYDVGPELTTILQTAPQPSGVVHVTAAEAVSLVYLLNPMRFSMETEKTVELQSPIAPQLSIELVALAPANQVFYDSVECVARSH